MEALTGSFVKRANRQRGSIQGDLYRELTEKAMVKIGAVINHESGTLSPQQAQKRLEEIRGHLEDRVSPEFLFIATGKQVEKKIVQLINQNIEVLIVGGGDGTVSTAARLVADTSITLAVIGLGTRNHFARDLDIPTDPVKAIRLLDNMQTKQIDLGEVNDYLFINNATLGIYPIIVEKRDENMQKHGWKKWRAHIAAAWRVAWWLPKMRLAVEGENFKSDYYTPFLFIGNNEYEGAMIADSKRSSLDDGKLWFCMARATGIRTLLHIAWQITVYGIQETGHVETRLVESVTVYSRNRKVKVAVDGEKQQFTTPLQFNIRRKSLKVVVP